MSEFVPISIIALIASGVMYIWSRRLGDETSRFDL